MYEYDIFYELQEKPNAKENFVLWESLLLSQNVQKCKKIVNICNQKVFKIKNEQEIRQYCEDFKP